MSFFEKIFEDWKKRVYLDFAASTPIDPKVLAFIREAEEKFVLGNPSSIHQEGREAKEGLERTRGSIARLLGVKKEEIIFTSGGSESDNLAIFGVGRRRWQFPPHIISSSIEHSAVIEPIRSLQEGGADVTWLLVSKEGVVSPNEVRSNLKKNTVLVSVSLVNSEIGVENPIREIGKVIDDFKRKNNRGKHEPPFFHVDASQAANLISIRPHDLGADLLTLDGAKIYGPQGVGILFVGSSVELEPLIRGGGQEWGKRSGTQNISLINGFFCALSLVEGKRDDEWRRLEKLKNHAVERIKKELPLVSFNALSGRQLPSYLNICIRGVDAEFLSVKLDSRGFSVSSASACRSISNGGSSYVIENLPGGGGCGKSSLRITFGRTTTKSEVDQLIDELKRELSSTVL